MHLSAFEHSKPCYAGGGLVNLMASLGQAFDVPSRHYNPLVFAGAGDLATRLCQARTVVLWVVDGLGDSDLRNPVAGALARDRLTALDSVFPATTAAAITTFMTGMAPREHAVTGWFVYLHELGAVTAWLPFGPRVGKGQWARLLPESVELLKRESLFDRMRADAHLIQPKWLINTPYSKATRGRQTRCHGINSLSGLVKRIGSIARSRSRSRRRFVYAYWPDLDSLRHRHGVNSPQAQAEFEHIEAAYRRLLGILAGTDSLLLVTADHGLVDTGEDAIIKLEDHPDLAAMLALPLCGEPRAAYAYLRPGTEADFDTYVSEHLGDVCAALPSADMLASGWFGPGPEHPQLRRRIGDRVLLPASGWVIKDRLPGEEQFNQIGVHGGGSYAERQVPLISPVL
ncbi:alkaline phosphatase family protein [Halorhodospira halochloris]|uniref:alkaline phosphatase family protein n=1 Tax=Halorhodospira halochloris TaxID=1052 RepID=UPI001EE790E9|nr:alkaline phosphatase family protein [Halorhodospira halochloris]MCG5530850.1 alkaline phosphatase family protein [Halorhodospira halochloris]